VSRSFSTRPCHQVAKKARVNPPNATKLAKSQPMVAISGLVLSRSDHQDPSRGANTNAARMSMLYKPCSLQRNGTRSSAESRFTWPWESDSDYPEGEEKHIVFPTN